MLLRGNSCLTVLPRSWRALSVPLPPTTNVFPPRYPFLFFIYLLGCDIMITHQCDIFLCWCSTGWSLRKPVDYNPFLFVVADDIASATITARRPHVVQFNCKYVVRYSTAISYCSSTHVINPYSVLNLKCFVCLARYYFFSGITNIFILYVNTIVCLFLEVPWPIVISNVQHAQNAVQKWRRWLERVTSQAWRRRHTVAQTETRHSAVQKAQHQRDYSERWPWCKCDLLFV